jgi:hypothetical protein
LLLGNTGCKKKPAAGLGGNANLKISAFHHTFPIDSCTVYIKFNSSEAPADNQFDLEQPLSKDGNGNSFTTFTGLKKGDYYLFARGWDPSISETVKGGIPYTINTEENINITVPVTED